MIRKDRRKKANAVFLSVVMILSVLSMGTAGLAAAAEDSEVTTASASEDLVQAGDEVTINGSVEVSEGVDATVHVYVEGVEEDAQEASTTVDEDDSEYSVSVDAPDTSGDYTVNVYLDTDQDDLDREADVDASTSFKVDADEPLVTAVSPDDGDVVNEVEETIEFEVTDNQSADVFSENEDLELVVDLVSDDTSETFVIDPVDGTNTDGIDYDSDDGTLTIMPGSGDVPALDEGDVDATVTATDEAGNENTTTFSFVVADEEVTADLSEVDDIGVTNDVNETFTVTIESEGGVDLAETESTLTIDNGNGYDVTLDNESDAYNVIDDTTAEFVVDPAEDDQIDSFDEDETYTVEVSAENVAGNDVDASETFDVDTDAPGVDSVDLSGVADPVNEDIDNEEVTVNFNQSIVTSSVEATISADGEEASLGAEDLVDSTTEYDDSVTFDADDALESLGEVDDDEAVINVTAAEDEAGNELANPDADASNETFAIDTVPPSVELADEIATNDDGTVSGLTDFEQFIEEKEDVDDLKAEIYIGGSYQAAVDVTDDLDSIPTQDYHDGEHVFVVTVTDENDNVDTAASAFVLDNDDTIVVEQEFLPGTETADAVTVGEDLTLSEDVFDAPADTDFYVDGEPTEEFDVEEFDNGETVEFKADTGTETVTVEVTVDFLEVQNFEVDDGTVTVEFVDATDVDELDVTIAAEDNYFDDEGPQTLTVEDFVQVGDDEYEAALPDLRDGQFIATLDSVASGTQSLEPDNYDVFEVDEDGPEAIKSVMMDADEGSSQAYITFDQPVDASELDADDLSLEDDRVNINRVQYHFAGDRIDDSGFVVVNFDQEFQTSDAPEITVDEESIDSLFGDSANDDSTSTELATTEYGLAEGFNVISVPAVTGDVDVEQFDEDGIEAIWAYDADDEEWSSWVPDADDNDLDALEGGEGYVVVAEEDTVVTVNAENVPASADDTDVPQVPTEQNLAEGWNLIGHYQLGAQSQAEAFSTIEDSVDTVQRGYTGGVEDEVFTGEGYWVNMDESDNYAPTNFGDVGPNVLDVTVSDEPVDDGDTVEVSVQVEPDEAAIDSVAIYSGELEIHAEELTEDTSAGGQGVTFTGEVDANFHEQYEGAGDAHLDVVVEDTDSNVVSDSLSVETVPQVTSIDATNDGPATADGTDKVTFTVTVEDAEGEPVEETAVDVDDADGLTGLDSDNTTNENGVATFTATTEDADDYTVQFSEADAGSATSEATFEAGEPASIEATNDGSATADGDDEVTFTVTVTDENDNPVEGATVDVDDAEDVDALDGIESSDSDTTDADGEATFTATSDDAGDFTVQFSEADAGSATSEATFEAGDVHSVTITDTNPGDETVTADGTDTVAYTVEVTDANGNAIEGVDVDGSVDGDAEFANEEQSETLNTGEDGTVTFEVSNEVAEDVSVTFEDAENTDDDTSTATFEEENGDT